MAYNNPKGTRDITGKESEAYEKIMDRMRHYFRLYGFEFMSTPHMERMSVLTSKFSGGEEIIKEIFSLQDQGKRNLGLRYDHTIPFSRFVASRPDLNLPYMRATIGSVFRDGPVKTGRLREFSQADCDIYGAKGIESEILLLSLSSMIYDDLNLDVDIRINHRILLESIILSAGVPINKVEKVMLVIDKLLKIGQQNVVEELSSIGITNKQSSKIFDYINTDNDIVKIESMILEDNTIKPDIKENMINAIKELSVVLSYNINGVRFDPSLARGLNYYTGIVFEAFYTDSAFNSSIAAGGRYKSIFKREVDCVGISFGIDAMMTGADISITDKKPRVYVIPLKDNYRHANDICRIMRKENIITGIDIVSRTLQKNLKYADAKGYDYVLIVGDKEVSEQKYTLRNLDTGKEQSLKLTDIIRMLGLEHL
ncbi:MAG: histidine--tRNA ligase [Candidatus Woesearchaeota archaeon]